MLAYSCWRMYLCSSFPPVPCFCAKLSYATHVLELRVQYRDHSMNVCDSSQVNITKYYICSCQVLIQFF